MKWFPWPLQLVAAAVLVVAMAYGLHMATQAPPPLPVVDVSTAIDIVTDTAKGKAAIIGPDKIAVGEGELFDVKGVTAEEFAQCSVALFPIKNRPQVLVLQTLNSQPVLYVKGRHPWKGAIILDVNIPDAYQIVIHELTIGGGPIPPPPPPPPGKGLTVIIIEESSDRTPEQYRVMMSPWRAWMKGEGYLVRIVDKDIVGPKGKPPPDLAAFLTSARNKDLPHVYFVADDGSVYEDSRLPDALVMMAAVKKWGAKKP